MVHKNNSRSSETIVYTHTFDNRAEMIITPIEISEEGNSERMNTNALWDTGSNRTCIIDEIVGKLGLIPNGTATWFHTGNREGEKRRKTYLIDIILPKNILYKSITVAEMSDRDGVFGDYGIVIGMDIIKTGNFIVENIGRKTKMTFRTFKSKNNKIGN